MVKQQYKYYILVFYLSISCVGKEVDYVLRSPYEDGYKYQYKVNLHAHTTERSENYAYSPEDLLLKAREYGFDAFAITDLPDAGGIVRPPNIPGILHIPGIEYGGKPHLVGIGIDSVTRSEDKQAQIDHIKSQNGIAYIPHPYFGQYDEKLLESLRGFDGVAVFNSLTYGVAVFNGQESEVIPYNEKLIDAMLSKGRSIAIIAEEDTKYEIPHNYGYQLNTAWMKVWGSVPPSQLKLDDLMDAIKEKRFTNHARQYRNHPEPPEFKEISIDGFLITVKLNNAYKIEFITSGGVVKKEIQNDNFATFEVSPDDVYVRIKVTCTGKNPSWAWTNPIYVERKN